MNELIRLGKQDKIAIEIYKVSKELNEINTLNEEVKLSQISDITTYNIKAIDGRRSINITVEDISNPRKVMEYIKDIFRLQDNTNENRLASGNISNTLDRNEQVDNKTIINDLISINDLKDKYSCISSIELSYCYNKTTYNIVNSNANLLDEVEFYEYAASIVIENNKEKKVVYVEYVSKDYDISGFKKKIIEKLESANFKLDSSSIETNKYKVILNNNVVSNILATFSNSFQSKSIYMKDSVLTKKFNTKVFSDKLSIVEDSPSGINNRCFDSEGVEKKNIQVVKNGVFVKKLNNLEYALKFDEEPTGNAGGVNNLYIEAGEASYENLVKELGDGIIIDEVYGLHSGVNEHTGDISVQAEGLLVKDGKIERGLEMIILSTNIFEVFGNVVDVGNDLSTDSVSTSAPSLLLQDITITGGDNG